MAEIRGFGLSHYPGLLVPAERWPHMLQRNVDIGRLAPELYADATRWPEAMRAEWGSDAGLAAARAHEQRLLAGYARLRAELDAFDPDVVLIWGDDQFENFRGDCIPAFCVYIFDALECRPYGGGRRPFQCEESAYGVPPNTPLLVNGHREAASGLARALLTQSFDVAYATETRADSGLAHSFNNTIVFLDRERRGFRYPVVPFHVNCYGNQLLRGARPDLQGGGALDVSPPSPSPRRCFEIGRATARWLAASPWRVALVASSSWSHGSLTAKHGRLYPDLDADRRLHADLLDGGYERWGELDLAALEDAGQHETLNWICLAGAMAELGHRPRMVDFVESHLFNSSKCFALFEPARPDAREPAAAEEACA